MTWNISFPMYNTSLRVANAYRAMAEVIAETFSASTAPAHALVDAQGSLETLWLDEKNLLSQTCGYPLVTQLNNRVQLVATPVFSFMQDCPAGYYRSAFVVSKGSNIGSLEECRGKRLAMNNSLSNSGMNVLRHAVSAFADHHRFFSDIAYTGGHKASMEWVVEGKADLASIDEVTLRYTAEDFPQLTSALTIIGYSIATPALPLIAATKVPPAWINTLRTILQSLTDRIPQIMKLLHIGRFTEFPLADYQKLLALKGQPTNVGVPWGDHRIMAKP